MEVAGVGPMTENLMDAILAGRARFAAEVSEDVRPGLSAAKTDDDMWCVSFVVQHDGAMTVLEDVDVRDRSDAEIYDLIDAARDDVATVRRDRAA